MKVRAVKRGYFGGQYRLPGDVFDCPTDQAFSNKWMVKVKRGKQPAVEKPNPDEYRPLEIPTLGALDVHPDNQEKKEPSVKPSPES